MSGRTKAAEETAPCIDTTPVVPKPPGQFVLAAARDIPDVLANCEPCDDAGTIRLNACALAQRLRDAGHKLAAAQWAIHESVRAGRLQVARFGRRDAPADVPKGRDAFRRIMVIATELLWKWRQASAVQRAERVEISADVHWVTVSAAAKISGIAAGVISRAVTSKELKGKGTGRKRRICPADLTRWQLERSKRPEPRENQEKVTERLRRIRE